MQLSPYVFLHLISAVFLGGLGVYLWLNRTAPVTASIAQLLFLCSGLALDYVFDLSSFSLPDKLFWMKGRFLFIAVAPVLWLVMIVRYIGQEYLITRRRLVLLFVVPVITIVLAWTSDHHTLFRYNYRLDDSGLFPILLWNSGPWYWIHICYSYVLFVASLILLLLSLRNAQSFYRRQSLMIIGGASLPVIADAVFHTSIPQLPGYIISTSILFLAGTMIVWALFHYGMLNIVPIARSVVLEKMNDSMIVLDGRNRVVDFNAAAHEVFGLQSAQSIGRPLEILLSRWPDLLLHCRKLQCVNEAVQISEGTSQRFYDLSIIPTQHRRDEVTGRVIILRDITDRQTAEEALRKSEEKYRLVVENAKEAIIIAQDLKLVFVNRAAVDMMGYSGEILVSKPFIDFIHPDDRNMVVDYHIRRLKGEKVPLAYSFRVISQDGTIKWVEFNTAVIQWKERPATLSFLNDITARKQAEEALRESEKKYRLITENTADLISTLDMNLHVTYVSPASMRLRGFTVEEAMEQPLEQVLTPESMRLALTVFEKEMELEASGTADPDRMRILELEEYKKDGSTVWVEVSMSFLRDNDPKPVEILIVTRDITDRKRVEEEKRRLEERLQRAHKMEAIGTLAGGIAHDFNNLLMAIQGYTSLTLLTLDLDDPNRERLKIIQEQVQSGAELTRQLLGFARGGRYEVKPADINDVIQKTSSMFGRTKKEITIHMKYEKNLSPVEVDLGQMEQVFMNLYVNAWQAMPGGGEIYLQTENVFLNNKQALSYSVKPGKYVKITVTDTGTGIDEKTRERIFDPFFTTKAMGRGAGLGLATVYGIIKGHKGMINVYSEPGHGTTFTIYLPASEKKVVKKETATGTIDRGTETILLVDDEKIVLEANREMLESMGYRVYAVGSGQEAIALFMGKRNEIDLVILDMIMPGISGGETFDRLREINPEIKVLLSSGYSLNGEAQTIMDRGCKGFIQKPFQIEKLSQKVREMLD
jgi:PAS domain S-box-containing protein